MPDENYIKLDSFLKWQSLVETGGQAKLMIQDGQVLVNHKVETRRGRKLVNGDKVTLGGRTLTVKL
ncbi:MAG: RNA-binding S4 domain-containing protein [Anaerolineae bacterium]